MPIRAEEIASILREQIEQFDTTASQASVGTVIVALVGMSRPMPVLGENTTIWPKPNLWLMVPPE